MDMKEAIKFILPNFCGKSTFTGSRVVVLKISLYMLLSKLLNIICVGIHFVVGRLPSNSPNIDPPPLKKENGEKDIKIKDLRCY